MEIFKMNVFPNSTWGDGEIQLDNYDSLEDFIEDNAGWLAGEGGAFYKRNKDGAVHRKFTANSFALAIDAEYKECFDYNDAIESNNEIELMLALDNILGMLDANPDHICVKYSIECDISYLVIHKDDWKVLRNRSVRSYPEWTWD